MGDLLRRLIKRSTVIPQVELHPGNHCWTFKCRYCYGKGQTVDENTLTINDYAQLLEDLVGKTDLIEISGIKTDPLTYPDIYELLKLVKEKKFQFGIHTKGFFLNEAISELLNTFPTEGNYITFGIDASDRDTYNDLHELPKNSNVFLKVKQNISSLYKNKIKNKSKLRINLTYLLFKKNCLK